MTASNALELLPIGQEVSQRRLPLGPGAVVGTQGVTLAACPLARLVVRARVTGPIAAVEVAQAFSNPFPEAIELCYLFPLSATAAVSRFRAQVGQRTLEGQVQEKEEAKKNYTKAGRPSFLGPMFEREYAPVFSVALGLVQPGETITIEIAYAEFLTPRDGEFHFRFPLVVSPRLLSGASLEASDSSLNQASATLAPGLVAGPNLSVTVQFEVGAVAPYRMSCSQPTVLHRLQNGDLGIEVAKQGEVSNRDFILAFRYGNERAPQAFLRHSQHHFMLNITPPFQRPATPCPRDLVILVDISESSAGPRFEVVKNLIGGLLASLGPGERFAVVGFNHNIAGYHDGNFNTHEKANEAMDWLARVRPNGRADLATLLGRVLVMRADAGRSLGVVLVACGKVGNEPELYDQVALAGCPVRFFAVGLDTAVVPAFLRRLGAASRGSAVIFSSEEPLEPVVRRLVEDTRQPLVSDIMLGDQGLAYNPETLAPSVISGLGDQPITVLGIKAGQGGLEVRGRTFSGHPWGEQVLPSPCLNPAIAFVWASQKVNEMVDELKLIFGPRASKMKQMSLKLCEEYRLVTDLTAYVVVEPQNKNADGMVRGSLLPSLNPWEWKADFAHELSHSGERTRLYERRLNLPPVPAAEDAPAAPEETQAEPPPVRPGLVRSEEEPASAQGLRPKTPILSQKRKHNKDPKIQEGGKQAAKPVFKKGGTEQVPKKPQLPRPGQKAIPGGGPAPSAPKTVNKPQEEPTGYVAVMEAPPVVAPPTPPAPEAFNPPTAAPVVEAPVQRVATPAPPPPAPNPAPAQAPAENEAFKLEAKELLRGHAELRQALMTEMRVLYQAVAKAAQGGQEPQIPAYLEKILRRLQPFLNQSPVIKEVYRVGVLCYQAIQAKDAQALARTQQWIQKFATLF